MPRTASGVELGFAGELCKAGLYHAVVQRHIPRCTLRDAL